MELNIELYKDLLKEFNARKITNEEQIALLEPLAAQMKSSTIQRLLKNWTLVFFEILCWVFVIACIAVAIFTKLMPPFNGMVQALNSTDTIGMPGYVEMENSLILTRVLFGGMALLWFFIARMIASTRHKNTLLAASAKNIKKVAEQLLRERSTNYELTEKYPYDLPLQNDTVIANPRVISDNQDVLL
jgi:glucan phosphoethanolaminetransferase (alkaline phosphatase superfamily)